MTSHEEITQWITSMLPPPAAVAAVKQVDYDEYVSDCSMGNPAM